jgi:rod shape determining protein RodA
MMDRRLIREASFDLTGKLWQVNWLYVLLLCALAGVGYVALYSAGGGSAGALCDTPRDALRDRRRA